MSTMDTIAFIGGGNMARSLVAGLRARGATSPSIRVAEPIAGLRSALQRDFGVEVFPAAADAVASADTWVLAAKPQSLRAICEGLSDIARRQRPLVVSIAAGIGIAQLQRWFDDADLPVVRAMPNVPAQVGAGVTALHAGPQVAAAGRAKAERLLAAVGAVVWLDDEAAMDAVTAVSGSGPAYVFLLAEAMLDAARAQGLPPDTARTLVLQTMLGAARMLSEDSASPAELRARVTSPGGTTQAAIEILEGGGFQDLIARAIAAAHARSQQLSLAQDPPCA
jgi:pyrroline-5-carboxylate reductase